MVRQYTNYWCVPAATQSMANLVRGTSNRSYLTQKFYYKRIRTHNRYTYRTLGNDPQGWAWGVRTYSGAPYAARAYSNKQQALDAIVASIAKTNDPVGVTVHGGTHAWVVLGYRTSHDPIEPTKKTILGFYVSGPLGSTADTLAVRLPDHGPVQAALHPLPRVAAQRHLGREVGRHRPVTGGPRSDRGARMTTTCTPSSWPAVAGPDSTR